MFDRSSGHIGLCLLLLVSGTYVIANYGYAVWVTTTAGGVPLTNNWILTFVVLAVVAGGLGVVAAVGLWLRSPNGRRLGFGFVCVWFLLEAFALWGWGSGSEIATQIVPDPMAPMVRLWIALSIGLYLWGWAHDYTDRWGDADATY